MNGKNAVILRRIGGTALFMLGIVSLVLPFLPGWLFIGVGLYLLSIDSPGLDGRIKALRIRYPIFDGVMQKVDKRFRKSKDEAIIEPHDRS